MAKFIKVIKFGKSHRVVMTGGTNVESDWFTAAEARKLASRLLEAAVKAESMIIKPVKKESSWIS